MVVQRRTKQRAAVGELLAETPDFRTAQQVHDSLKLAGNTVGLATVYRTLQDMAKAGDLDVLRNPEGESMYRQCERREHHHHLVCRVCGAAVEIDGPSVEAWARAMGVEHGYVSIDHTFELTGTCASCATAA